jgi:hypothetical protein
MDWNSKPAVLDRIRTNGGQEFLFAERRLRRDPDVIIAALSENGLAFWILEDELCENREFIFTAVRQTGRALHYAPRWCRNDAAIMMAAVENNGLMLELASDELQSDVKIVKAAVNQCGMALQYASEPLKDNHSIVKSALASDGGSAIRFASDRLRQVPALMKIFMQHHEKHARHQMMSAWAPSQWKFEISQYYPVRVRRVVAVIIHISDLPLELILIAMRWVIWRDLLDH